VIQRICDVCKHIKQGVDGQTTIHRFTLRREVGTRFTGTRRQVGAGGIDICDECWEKICKPRTNPNKQRAVKSRWAKVDHGQASTATDSVDIQREG
jgi:hypothetical protein